MKNKKIMYISMFMLFSLFISGCNFNLPGLNNTSTSSSSSSKVVTDAQIIDFDVNESRVDTVDIGDTYTIKAAQAKDNYGNYYVADISVFDSDNVEVEVTNNTFRCTKFGRYKVTYTVNYNISDSVSKSYYVEVVDVSAPYIDTELYIHNISRPGQVIDLSNFNILDNSGEIIDPEIKVLFNGVEEPNALVDDKLTVEKEGTYVLEVNAKDSNDNEMFEEYYIHTLLDFENGYSFDLNESYGTDISDSYSFNGTHSYEFGAFENNPSWFNDYSMLGFIKVLDDAARYVSFWIYFENEDYTNVMKAIYHSTKIYDSTGKALPEYHLGGYEMKGAQWYRMVVDMTELEMSGEFFDHDDAVANPETLGMLPFYFGVWDAANNSGATKSQKIYIDDVKLTNTPEDEEYKAPVSTYDFPENCVVDFESEDQIEALTASWRSNYSLSKKYKTSGDYSYKFDPFITYSSLTFTGFCSGIDSLEEYTSLSVNVYIDDNSGNNVYDDNTKFHIALSHKDENGKATTIQTYAVKENKKWVTLIFNLCDYSKYKLSDRGFYISMYKYVNKEVITTYEYEGISLYFDDIYVGVQSKYNAGEEIVNVPYASNNGNNIYSQIAASETGYMTAGTLAKYGIGHGTYENYEMFNKNYLGETKSNTVSGLTSEYQYFAANTDHILTVVEATDHCFARFTINEELLEVYYYGNVYLRKYDAAADTWITIYQKQGSNKEALAPYLQCEYQELNAGDKLVLDVVNLAGGWRYLRNPSGVAVATALEEGETITLKSPTNLKIVESNGLHTVTFDKVNSASGYVAQLLDSSDTPVVGFEEFEITSGSVLDLSNLETGDYSIRVKALGTGIFTSSEYCEKVTFNYVKPVVLTIEEVKVALLDSANSFNALETLEKLRTGGTDEFMTIGLLAGETSVPVAPGGQNGWCGFTRDANGSGFRVQFLANTAPDAFYYTYTAQQDGYIYIDQELLTWNGGTKSSIVASIGDEVVYTNERTHVGDGVIADKIAVHLNRGETLKVQVNHLSNPSRSVFGLRKMNITFVANKEVALPDGYTSLIDYLKA